MELSRLRLDYSLCLKKKTLMEPFIRSFALHPTLNTTSSFERALGNIIISIKKSKLLILVQIM